MRAGLGDTSSRTPSAQGRFAGWRLAPRCDGGLYSPGNLIVVGSWWTCRDIELASMILANLSSTWSWGRSRPTLLCRRNTHRRRAPGGGTVVSAQLQGWRRSTRRAYARSMLFVRGVRRKCRLLPRLHGQVPSKQASIDTIREAASPLGLALFTLEGVDRWGGALVESNGSQTPGSSRR